MISLLSVLIISCDPGEFDFNNPKVKSFVEELKAGTYDDYELGDDGQNLWLKMPAFNENHIASLIELANDTTRIDKFPLNPISSRTPYPNGRSYLILGECLLWTVEGIRNGSGYGSLDPYLIDATKDDLERYFGLSNSEILDVRELYQAWWDENKNGNWEEVDPLEGTGFAWF